MFFSEYIDYFITYVLLVQQKRRFEAFYTKTASAHMPNCIYSEAVLDFILFFCHSATDSSCGAAAAARPESVPVAPVLPAAEAEGGSMIFRLT